MATITPKSLPRPTVAGGLTPWGNLVVLRYVLQTTDAGGVVNGNSPAAIAIGDVVNVGIIPEGLRLIDSQVIVKEGLTASVTGKLGFAYTEPATGDVPAADDDYFGSGLVLSAAARLRNAMMNTSVVLPKQAYLTLTIAGAANAKAGEIEIIIYAIAEGVK